MGSLNAAAMSSNVGDLVRREHRGVGQCHRLAEIEHVRRGALALLLVGGVDLVLAGGVGLRRVDLDAVLVGERLDDGAVVGPIRRQGNHIELALLLGRRDEGVHPAEVRGGCRLADLDAGGRLAAVLSFWGGAHAIRPARTSAEAAETANTDLSHCRTFRWVGGGAVAQRLRRRIAAVNESNGATEPYRGGDGVGASSHHSVRFSIGRAFALVRALASVCG